MSVYDLYQSYLNAQKQPTAAPSNILDPSYLLYLQQQQQGGGEGQDNQTNVIGTGENLGINSLSDLSGMMSTSGMIGGLLGGIPGALIGRGISNFMDPNRDIFGRLNDVGIAAQVANMAQARGLSKQAAADAAARGVTGFSGYGTSQQRGAAMHGGGGSGNSGGGSGDSNSPDGGGGYCFDPNTPVQMADGSEKKIKDIQLGDETKGGEVTGVFQFKAADEIHNYKGVTVAGSHYVKENGKFIMVKDSPIAVKIDKIPVVYSLDTSGRRIFIKDIEFADYNGDGIAKNFLNNAGVDLSGFDKEVLRQVENRIL